MASQSAIDGVSANGLKWKYQIRLNHFNEVLANANDNGVKDPDFLKLTCKLIAKQVQQFLTRPDCPIKYNFEVEEAVEWLLDIDPTDPDVMEDINHAMNVIYDEFDYWRVLVV